ADDPYARLAEAVQDAGGRPVNPPHRSRAFTDKAAAHAELRRHGLGVPETVGLHPGPGERPLTAAGCRRPRLDEPGAAAWAKPANGFCGKGIVRCARADREGLASAVAAARDYDPHDALLVQREVGGPHLRCDDGVERRAYWRVLYCLGELI